jgi:hypothetical protein
MPIYTLASPGGSPGVTTSALAVTYAWGGRTLLAECDPKGGSVLSGFLRGRIQGPPGGLLDLARSAARTRDPAMLWDHLISLDQDVRDWLLLPGLRDPREVAQLHGAWGLIAEILAATAADLLDAVIDVGRIGGSDTPMELIAASDLVVMMLRPTLGQVAAAKPRLDALGRHLGTSVPVGLCLVGRGDYRAWEISDALFGLPVIGELPHDGQSAAVLSEGRPARRSVQHSALLRGAATLAGTMRTYLEQSATTTEADDVAAVRGVR